MARKKPVVSLEQFSKAELITLVKKLQKQITKLQRASTARNTFLRDPEPADVVSDLVPCNELPDNWQDANQDQVQSGAMLPALPHGGPYTVMTIDRAEAEALAIRNAAAAKLDRRAKLPGIGPCKVSRDRDDREPNADFDTRGTPAFPWEQK